MPGLRQATPSVQTMWQRPPSCHGLISMFGENLTNSAVPFRNRQLIKQTINQSHTTSTIRQVMQTIYVHIKGSDIETHWIQHTSNSKHIMGNVMGKSTAQHVQVKPDSVDCDPRQCYVHWVPTLVERSACCSWRLLRSLGAFSPRASALPRSWISYGC